MVPVSERHTRWLFIALLVGQLILLTVQARNPDGEASLLEAATVRALAPLAAFVEFIADGTRNVGSNFRLNRTLRAENEELRIEVQRLRRENLRLFGVQTDLERLQEAVAYERLTGAPLQAADIVYIDHSASLQTAILAIGSGRVEVGQPVVSTVGLVGRVVLVTGRYAKIQLITDRSASVGAMIQRTRRQGIIRGGGEGSLELDYIPTQSDVRVGDRVVTAGIDGVYPRGVPVGTVAAVAAGTELFHRIRVAPHVDFGVLDQVFVLDQAPVPEELKGELSDASP